MIWSWSCLAESSKCHISLTTRQIPTVEEFVGSNLGLKSLPRRTGDGFGVAINGCLTFGFVYLMSKAMIIFLHRRLRTTSAMATPTVPTGLTRWDVTTATKRSKRLDRATSTVACPASVSPPPGIGH